MVSLSGCYATSHARYLHVHYFGIIRLFILCICASLYIGGEISIRVPCICAVHEFVPTNRKLSSPGPLSVQ